MKIKKMLYAGLGCVGVALGALGAAVPLLPAFPFLLLAAFCFAKSSERLHNWFIGTKLYKNNLESYVKGRGMTWKTKIRIMAMVTLTMAVGFLIDGPGAGGADYSGLRLGFPHFLFRFWRKDSESGVIVPNFPRRFRLYASGYRSGVLKSGSCPCPRRQNRL